MASPLDGIGLLMSFSRLAAIVAGTMALAQSAASVFRRFRRESRAGKVISLINLSGNGSCQASKVYSGLRLLQVASRSGLHQQRLSLCPRSFSCRSNKGLKLLTEGSDVVQYSDSLIIGRYLCAQLLKLGMKIREREVT